MSQRKNEKLFVYLAFFMSIYGLSLLGWPFFLYVGAMSLGAPSDMSDAALKGLGYILISYPLGVLFAIFYCGICYQAGRFKSPYWVIHVPWLWPMASLLVAKIDSLFHA